MAASKPICRASSRKTDYGRIVDLTVLTVAWLASIGAFVWAFEEGGELPFHTVAVMLFLISPLNALYLQIRLVPRLAALTQRARREELAVTLLPAREYLAGQLQGPYFHAFAPAVTLLPFFIIMTIALAGLPPEPPRRLRILVAEDRPANRRLVQAILTRRGHDPVLVEDGQEALEQAVASTFDTILMDMQMPRMNGLEATAAIREHERGSGNHVRIIAMTAHAMRGDRERCLAAGMDGCMTKPLKISEILALVAETPQRS